MTEKPYEWVGKMFHEAMPHKGFPLMNSNDEPIRRADGSIHYVLHLRGLHYYIVSLPLEERQIPTRNKTREYKNTRTEYKRLSKLLIEARLAGLVADDLVFDNRNEPVIEAPDEVKFHVKWRDYNADSGYYYTFKINEVKDFDDFVKSIEISNVFANMRFHNQMYEMVVITEKLTVRAVIVGICKKYGANCLVSKGQSSFTRITDVCNKAKSKNKPLLVLGIYDLDCAGWDMGNAVMKRIQEKYPHPHHRFERIALTREQAIEYDLPISFQPDDKNYPEAQKERFYKESDGKGCIELDALNNITIKDLLEERLQYYGGLKLDRIQSRRLRKKENKRTNKITDNMDFSDYKNLYERWKSRWDDFHNDVMYIKTYLKAKYRFISDKLYDIEEEIKESLEEELNKDN